MTEQMKKKIDEVFALWSDGVCPGGQVAVRCKGEMVYDRCFGYADVENRLPVTDESVFHVASVSKQLTVMAVLLLCEDGVLDICGQVDVEKLPGHTLALVAIRAHPV